jgi:peptidoglycan/xylan/chitin deacetylase (PgdA/CDA1 family)
MKERVKRGLAGLGWRVLRLTGRRPETPRIPVIMYHSVGGGGRASLAPEVAAAHFEAIRDRYARCVTISELAALPVGGSQEWLPAITFDDGYEDNHRVVLPLLRRLGLKATFFVCSGFIDGRASIAGRWGFYQGLRPMTWAQVRELADAGMEIGAHTDTHPLLARLPVDQQEREMLHSKERIEREVGRPVVSFAVPYGSRGTYSRATLSMAARHFQVCCTTRFATNPARPRRFGQMMLLDRLQAAPEEVAEIVIEKMSGRWDAMRVLQRSRFRP